MHAEVQGRRDPGAATVLLSSGLGGSGAFWLPQLPALAEHFRVVTYDHRGTGRTGGEVPQGCTIADMADDALQVLDQLGIARCHFIGHAIGGLIGLEIALRRPERLDRLIAINSWSKGDPHTARCFAVRRELLLRSGPDAFVQAQPIFLYPANWLAQNVERIGREEAAALAHFPGATTVLRRIDAALAFDLDDRLGEIHTPTLVLATRDDVLVPYSRSQRLAAGLPRARLELLPFGGHSVTVVEPDTFNQLAVGFLTG